MLASQWIRSAAATLGLACAMATPGIAHSKDKFTFAWPSAINSGVAPLSFAAKLGYFDKENIDLQIQVLTGSGAILPQLISGNIQGAYSSLESLVIARQPGKPNVPIVFVYNFLRNSIWEFAVLKNSPIQSVKDMKGKTIGVLALSSGNIFMTRAMLEDQGVPWSSVKVLAVGTGIASFEALKTDQIQVLNLFDTAHVRLEQGGTQIRRIPVPKAFDGMPSHGVSVSQRLLAENPDLVARFGRAMTKGIIACNANVEACVRAYWDAYPALRPAPSAEADTLKREKEVLAVRMKNHLHFRHGEPRQMGAFAQADWTNLIQALANGEQVTNTQIPLDTLYTNALVPKYNDFDTKAVEAQARSAK